MNKNVKKFIHKSHLNQQVVFTITYEKKQVVIELVFYNFFHMKKAGGY